MCFISLFEHTELGERFSQLKPYVCALRCSGGVSCRNYDKEADLKRPFLFNLS